MSVVVGGIGEHVALHYQRRLLFVGKAEERRPRCAAVQASGEKTADSAQRSPAVRWECCPNSVFTDIWVRLITALILCILYLVKKVKPLKFPCTNQVKKKRVFIKLYEMHKKLGLLFTCIRFSCAPTLPAYKLKDCSNHCFVAQANQVLSWYCVRFRGN